MVVVTGSWVKNVVSYPSNGDLITAPKMTARAVLICRPNSHPFQERTLALDQPVKIGRSVARARAVANNAIFDCKVLSRNHALLWYENGKFFLQDTKSSNGTFVNNQRLSKNAEESVPREVCSSDIVQFGVDVMENSRKVTHGCIVATLKLYLPDGKEAKPCPPTASVNSGMVPLEDLYQLNQYLQEAMMREQQLDKKLCTLQTLVENTRLASDLGWKALIDEDRLLSRVEILENQLQVSSKNFAEDKMREELRKLQEDKCTYQGSAKESLRQIMQEKLDAIQKLQTLEQSLTNSESEGAHLKKLCERYQQELQELSTKYSQQLEKTEELSCKLQDAEELSQEVCERLEQEKRELQNKLQEQLESVCVLETRLDTMVSDGDTTEKSGMLEHMEVSTDVILERINESRENTKEEVEALRHQLKQHQEELQENHAIITQLTLQLEAASCDCESLTELQQRLDDIDVQLSRDSNNCGLENNKDAAPNQSNELKAEKAKLQELLAEVRAKKLATEEQKSKYQVELDCTNVKLKKSTEEANLLRGELQSAQTDLKLKLEGLLELQKEVKCLKSAGSELKHKIWQLEACVIEEQQLTKKMENEANQLRDELTEAHQSARQSHNEVEQMKQRLRTVQAELEAARTLATTIENTGEADNKRVTLEHQCSSLEEENQCLLDSASIVGRMLDEDVAEEAPGQPTDDVIQISQTRVCALEDELVSVKQSYLRCSDNNTQLVSEIHRLSSENQQLASQNLVVPVRYIIAVSFLALVTYFFMEAIY